MNAPEPSPNATALPTLVVEDLPVVRDWLAALLARVFPGSAIETAATLREARQLLTEGLNGGARWRLALVDLGLPDGSGIGLIELMRRQAPETPVIVTTVHDDDDHLFSALAAGAQGYLLKEQDDEQLAWQLRQIERGQPPLSPRVARRMMAHFQPHAASGAPAPATLSPRETEVLSCIGRGLSAAETGQRLGITENTVNGYVKTLYSKLDIGNRAQAALEATRRGLV